MKVFLKTAAAAACISVLLSATAFAGGDAAKGKALFNDPKFAGSATGKSCSTCHPNGKGLEDAAGKSEWRMMGGKFSSLEAVVNYCIEKALHGKKIDPKSDDMLNIVEYIRSLKK